MSMSQEEIESLMNGLDFEDDSSSSEEEPVVEDSEPQGNMSEDDINELIAQTEDMANDEETSSESVDDILNSLENTEAEESTEETNIDDILKELEQEEPVLSEEVTQDSTPDVEIPEENSEINIEEPTLEDTIVASSQEVSNDNIDELLSSIDGIVDEPIAEVKDEAINEIEINNDSEEIQDIDNKINSGVFPLPVEEDTKVVNQLNAVANDSEEKATKIFDVLSNILDYNNAIQNDISALSSFNERQVAMLSSLSQKFPNIEAFSQNLEHAQQMTTHINDANENLNNGNTEIFQAMELMQYHDINRQKIERVMSVIKKLTLYLNNLFEDDSNRPEVAVAKHIHGDSNSDLVADDDLEALIAEFNN